MSDSSSSDESTDGYIRGGGASLSVSRHAVQILVVAVLLALAGLTIAYAVTAHNETSRRDRLHRHGVPVAVTVTQCRGEATGTGIIESQFFCRGTFVLVGHRYTDAITDSSAFIEPGTVIAGVADSRDPSLLSTEAAVAHTKSAASAYSGVVVCGGGFLLVLILALWARSRRRGRGTEPAEILASAEIPDVAAPAEPVTPAARAELVTPAAPVVTAEEVTPPPPRAVTSRQLVVLVVVLAAVVAGIIVVRTRQRRTG